MSKPPHVDIETIEKMQCPPHFNSEDFEEAKKTLIRVRERKVSASMSGAEYLADEIRWILGYR